VLGSVEYERYCGDGTVPLSRGISPKGEKRKRVPLVMT
jgi:hypothetical protein